MTDTIRVMAEHFASGVRHPESLAGLLRLSSRTVRRYHQTDAFHAALDALRYTGDRLLEKKPTRVVSPAFYEVKKRYESMTDVAPHKRLKIIAQDANVTYKQLCKWRRWWEHQ